MDRHGDRKTAYLKVLKRNPRMEAAAGETVIQQNTGLFPEAAVREAGAVSVVQREQKIIWETASCVLAPALNSFVLWVLKEAVRRGIQRLYFLARDGYFLYETARVYVNAYKLPVECRYLYASRYSLRVPMYHTDLQEALAYITLGGLDVTLYKVLRRASLTEEQIEAASMRILKAFPSIPDRHAQISREQLWALRKILKKDAEFLELVTENSKAAYPPMLAYFRQEGFGEDVPMAIVDSGWVGTMQKLLSGIRQSFGAKEPLEGFYFGLYEIPKDVERCRYHTYFFSPEGDIKRKVHFSNCLFEGVFSAPHGMTLAYKQTGAFVEPIMTEITGKRREQLLMMKRCFARYQEALLKEKVQEDFWKLAEEMTGKGTGKVIERLLSMLMSRPGHEEAMTFGKMDFTDDVLEYGGNQMAAKLSERELFDNHLGRRVWIQLSLKCLGNRSVRSDRERKDAGQKWDAPIRNSAWYEGSVMAYGEPKNRRRHLNSYRRYKYVLYYRKRALWRKGYEAK